MKASEVYKQNVVNIINQEWQPDGTVIMKVYKEGWKKLYTFRVKNLGMPNEEIIEDEDVPEVQP